MEPNDVVHTEDQELHLTQEPVDAPVSRWGMVLLSMVWGMASFTTKEIVPPSNESECHHLGCYLSVSSPEQEMSVAN